MTLAPLRASRRGLPALVLAAVLVLLAVLGVLAALQMGSGEVTSAPATTARPEPITAVTKTVQTGPKPHGRPRPPRPSPNPPSSYEAASKNVALTVAGLPHAGIAFNTPRRLRRDQTARIQLILSPREPIAELKRRVVEVGQVTTATVKYSDTMRADLQSDDFDITPVGNVQKFVAPDHPTQWLWEIKPRHAGELHLYLTLSAIIDVAGETGPYEVATYSRTLTIHVAWATQAGDFVKANWQWLWTAVFVPVGLWVYRRRPKPQGDAATPTQRS